MLEERLLRAYVVLFAESLQNNLKTIEKKYPNIVSASKSANKYSMGNYERIKKSKNPITELEKFAVYETNPSLSWDFLGKLLPKLRKRVGDILAAYENDTLFDALEEMNLFGSASNAYKHEADREF